jgi:hypothetical protein
MIGPTRDQIVTGKVGLVVNGPRLGEWVDWPPGELKVIMVFIQPMLSPYNNISDDAGSITHAIYQNFTFDSGAEKVRVWALAGVAAPDLIDLLMALSPGAEFKHRFDRDIEFRFQAMKLAIEKTP